MGILLQSERLLIREIEWRDLSSIHAIMRSKGVKKVWEHDFTEEDTKEWIKRRKEGYRQNGIDYLLAIHRYTGDIIGQIGLFKEKIYNQYEWAIGYIVKDEYCRRGYATEGALVMIDYAFYTLGISKV